MSVHSERQKASLKIDDSLENLSYKIISGIIQLTFFLLWSWLIHQEDAKVEVFACGWVEKYPLLLWQEREVLSYRLLVVHFQIVYSKFLDCMPVDPYVLRLLRVNGVLASRGRNGDFFICELLFPNSAIGWTITIITILSSWYCWMRTCLTIRRRHNLRTI